MTMTDLVDGRVLAGYADAELVSQLRLELSSQRMQTARLIAFIGEVDERRLYREYAYSSMFEYAVRALHMSEGEAYPRIQAARIVRKYPAALEMLARGDIHLSGLRLVGRMLTQENHREVLGAIRFMSKREVERLVATREPKPDVSSSIRKLPDSSFGSARVEAGAGLRAGVADAHVAETQGSLTVGVQSGVVGSSRMCGSAVEGASADGFGLVGAGRVVVSGSGNVGQAAGALTRPGASGASGVAVDVSLGAACPAHASAGSGVDAGTRAATSRGDETVGQRSVSVGATAVTRGSLARVSALGESRYRVQFTAGQRLHDKLEQARHLLRHQVPDGDLAEICERALDLLIAKRMKERFGVGVKTRARKGARSSSRSCMDERGCAPRAQVERGERDVAREVSMDADVVMSPPATLPRDESGCAGGTAERTGLPSSTRSRHIPREVRVAVFARDGMRCTYVSPEGKRCAEQGLLEFHHVEPFGRGGLTTVENVCLRCRAHNALAAESDYGREFMRRRNGDSSRGVRDAVYRRFADGQAVWRRPRGAASVAYRMRA